MEGNGQLAFIVEKIMSKNALFAVCIYPEENKIPIEFRYAINTFEKYCEKYNLDLILVDKPKYNVVGSKYKYNYMVLEKFQAYDYFDDYDRLFKVDLDALITVNCPNVFDLVPEDCIGAMYEDLGKRRKERHYQMKQVQDVFGNVLGWTEGYFNEGIMVASKQHRDFNKLTKDDIHNFTEEEIGINRTQNVVNWKVRKEGYQIFPLEYKFNHMFMFDEVNIANIKRGSLLSDNTKNSYIIHYAGLKGKIRNRRMTRDYKKIIRDWKTEGY